MNISKFSISNSKYGGLSNRISEKQFPAERCMILDEENWVLIFLKIVFMIFQFAGSGFARSGPGCKEKYRRAECGGCRGA